jgi:predicted acetyltransferase
MAEEIRQIRPDELDTYFSLGAQAFQVDPANIARWRKGTRPEDIWGLFAEGEMRAALIWLDLQIWFGAAPVAVGGLAGVVTPPEARRQGYIGRLLRVVLDEMRGRDQPLSALYPFYFPFYKHYGWEHASDNHEYTIPVERLPFATAGGAWQRVSLATDPPPPAGQEAVSDADLAVLMSLYDAWVVGRSGALVRDAPWWRTRRLSRPANIYYWRDAAGRPRAYVSYTFKQIGDWDRQLLVRELVALDRPALQAALGFLRNHDSQAKEIVWTQPEDSRLLALLDDPRIKMEIDPGFMLRVLDVAAALSARRYPTGQAGQLVLRVAEGFVERTPHTYALDVADGIGTAAPTDADPDLSLDQRALAQLYSGYLTPQQALDLGVLEVHNPAALARAAALFAGPRPFMPDHF